MFREEPAPLSIAVGDEDIKDAPGAGFEVDIEALLALDCGRETRSPASVASSGAVDDLDFALRIHAATISG
jgi:hypothetical protein